MVLFARKKLALSYSFLDAAGYSCARRVLCLPTRTGSCQAGSPRRSIAGETQNPMVIAIRYDERSVGRHRHTVGTAELRSKRVVGDDPDTWRSRSSDCARMPSGRVVETNEMVLGVGNDDAA